MRCLNCHRDGIATSVEVCPQCGVYLPSLLRDVLPVGTLLRSGTYRLDYALGRGGFGITYRAIHNTLEQPVAVKEFYPQEQAVRNASTGGLSVLTTHQGAYQRGLERFVREGRILARLNHPHVVRVQDLFEEGGTAYLVMELLVGKTLRQELDTQPEGRMPRERVPAVMEPLVGALEAVHQAGVYHLDLKPDNVLLAADGRVVLVDFGAARQGVSSGSTQAYTLEYAAPEVIAGGDVGPQSDIFELGMMLYEMLVGERPTPALSRLLKDTWKPRELETPWRSLVEVALRVRKEERPPTMREWWSFAGKTGALELEEAITLTLAEAFGGVEKRLSFGSEVVAVRIPAGIKAGNRIRVRSKGGDLYLKVEFLPDPFFQFEGDHLVCPVSITPSLARTGGNVEVRTLDGSVSMRVPAGVRSGQLLRLRGKGWPRSEGGRGDQLVVLAIAPEATSKGETRTLAAIAVCPTGGGDYRTISEAIQNAAPGSRILVRPGHYCESLVIDKPLAILGDGVMTDIVIESRDADCILMQAEEAFVRGFTLRGRGGLKGNKFYAVDIPQGRLVLEDCDISSDSLACVAIHGSTSNPIVRRCQIHDGQSIGVFVYEKGRGTIEDCNIFANENSGVAIVQEGNPTLRRCRLYNGQAEGLWVAENGKGIFEDCDIFANAQPGVTINKGGAPTIRRCQIRNGQQGGIWVYEDGTGTIEDCEIFQNAKAGAEIKEGGNPLLRRCRIHDQPGAAVTIHSKGQGTLEDCDIFANPDAGVLVYEQGNPTLRHCQIHDGQSAGILFLEKSKGRVENSYIFANQEAGVVIGSGSRPVMRSCRIYNGRGSGILVGEQGEGRVEDCDIFGNANAGIAIYSGGNPVIYRCQIHDGLQGGVFMYDQGQGILEECKIFGSAKTGVEIKEGSTPTLRHCQIYDNKASGVFVWGNGQGLLEACEIFGNANSGVLLQEGGNPVIRECRINRNEYEAVWVCNQGAGTVENCDLTGNARGAWDIEAGSWVQRRGNQE